MKHAVKKSFVECTNALQSLDLLGKEVNGEGSFLLAWKLNWYGGKNRWNIYSLRVQNWEMGRENCAQKASLVQA